MVISSIDLKNGQVVQLKNGKDAVLERNDWQAIIEDFAFYGETAVIDLDAALGNLITEGSEKGNTVNTEIVHKLLRKGNVRVGGGVRSVKKAKELISLGAEKVIIGSSAWKDGALDEVFLTELTKAIGKQRIIISIDAIDGIIAVKGWKETAGIPLLEAAVQAEKWASELLFTCVEREGCMTGFDLALAKKLRKLVSCRLVVAGGVSSLEEIIALEKMQIDVQLGMALYTNVVSLRDAFVECLNWESAEKNTEGLISVIAQSPSGEVLMNGFANKEAFYKSIDEKKLTFWSRSRKTLWTKGESSGNILKVLQLRADCDRDA
ncbi:MAG TPA: HisA/HisF-related TIM barrel protein, partial [Treponemataceae bacterium]|nr:HisA/HisF-related TIM barrel protein [Treponemataceae bacterium]